MIYRIIIQNKMKYDVRIFMSVYEHSASEKQKCLFHFLKLCGHFSCNGRYNTIPEHSIVGYINGCISIRKA